MEDDGGDDGTIVCFADIGRQTVANHTWERTLGGERKHPRLTFRWEMDRSAKLNGRINEPVNGICYDAWLQREPKWALSSDFKRQTTNFREEKYPDVVLSNSIENKSDDLI